MKIVNIIINETDKFRGNYLNSFDTKRQFVFLLISDYNEVKVGLFKWISMG